MTRVLFVSEGNTSTADLLGSFMDGFSRNKGCIITKMVSEQVTAECIQNSDVVLCVRGESPLMCEILRLAKKAGRFVIFFLDDDLQHLPKNSFRYPQRKKYLLEGLKYADFFLTSNRLLAEEYLPLISGDRAGILETVVEESQIQARTAKSESEPVRIVYAASGAHVVQWDKYIAPVWPELTGKYGNRITMTFVGMHPKMPEQQGETEVTFIPPMKLADYRAYMYQQKFDIGLSPLDTDHFSARKYYNKFIEYTMCGIFGIYSDCSPYDLVVRDGENGILAGNSSEAWKLALERAIEEKLLRERCVDQAQQLLRDVFTEEKIHSRLVEDIPELISFQAPTCATAAVSAAAKLKYKMFRLSERLYLTVLSLKLYGVNNTLARIKSKIKK